MLSYRGERGGRAAGRQGGEAVAASLRDPVVPHLGDTSVDRVAPLDASVRGWAAPGQ